MEDSLGCGVRALFHFLIFAVRMFCYKNYAYYILVNMSFNRPSKLLPSRYLLSLC